MASNKIEYDCQRDQICRYSATTHIDKSSPVTKAQKRLTHPHIHRLRDRVSVSLPFGKSNFANHASNYCLLRQGCDPQSRASAACDYDRWHPCVCFITAARCDFHVSSGRNHCRMGCPWCVCDRMVASVDCVCVVHCSLCASLAQGANARKTVLGTLRPSQAPGHKLHLLGTGHPWYLSFTRVTRSLARTLTKMLYALLCG